MLKEQQVAQVQRLLAEGLFQRQVALRTGVSRGAIGQIANGTWAGFREDYRERGPLNRCPQCGSKVYGACRACRIQKLRKELPEAELTETEQGIRLELTPAQRAVYEEVHRQKPPAPEPRLPILPNFYDQSLPCAEPIVSI